MATLQGKAVKNTYRQVLQIGANNVGVSSTLQPVQDGTGTNTSLSLSTTAATVTGDLTINGDLIITGGGIQIQDLIDDTVATLIQNGTGITWAYNDTLRTLTPTITIATADGGAQADYLQLNIGAGEASAVGKIYWNSTDGTAELGLMGGQVVLPIGEKQVARVLNNSGTIFTKAGYQVVKIIAAQGQRLAVGLAQANNDANSTDTLGLVAENIANNQEGFITTSGLITGIDTTGDLQLEDWNDGDILYLSPTTPGAITKVKPVAPQHTIIVGFVVYSHKNNGKIYVKVDNGYELDELHNVRITSVADNNILQYNSSLGVWENVAGTTTNIAEGSNLYYTQARFDSDFAGKTTTNLAEGTNLYFTSARSRAALSFTAGSGAYNSTTGVITIPTNTNQLTNGASFITLTSLSGGTGISYNNTTGVISSTIVQYTDAMARTAISLTTTGTSGAATYNSTTGVLNIPQYQAVLTNPVTGTGTTNTLPKFTGSTAIGNSNITDTGSLITLGSDTTISSGGLGIGTTSLTNYGIRISKNLTGAASGYGVSVDGTIQPDVSTARFYNSTPTTQAGAYTLGSLQHYVAATTTIGAGSSITNQYGFLVLSTAIGATNNYAFSGQLAAATNTWNLYMSGTAPNYLNGSLSIGTTTSTAYRLIVGGTITGSTTSYGVYSFGTIQSDVTSAAFMYRATPSTAAASFTLTNLFNYHASAGTVGAGATITNHFGYYADALSIGTNNYGFYGAVAAGTGRWNLFMFGTADNYLAGNIGIGSSQNFVSAGPILTTTLTDGGTGYVDGTYTDVASTNITGTGNSALFTVIVSSGIITSATLTWGGMSYKSGDTVTISNTLLGGTGSGLIITINTVDSSQLTIASANGGDISLFRNDTSLTVTENIGSIKFLSNDISVKASGIEAKISAVAAGSSGGAYLSFFTSTGAGGALTEQLRIGNGGQVGIGGAYSLTGYSLRISKDVTGSTTTFGVQSDGVIQSGVTTQFINFRSFPSTVAASFTLTDLIHFNASQSTIGAGSSVTSQVGFNVSSTLTGATTNYGFFGNIAAGTGRWNLYMAGTADNYLAGNTGIGNSANFTSAGVILTTTLTNGGSGYVDGTYTDVAATNIVSNGVYALFTIVVSGGVVTTATLTWGGSTYRAGDTLTVSNTLLGGTGSGLIITVNTVDSSQLTIAGATGADITLLRNDTTLNPNDNVGTIKWMSNDSTTKASGIVAEISANGESTNGGAYLSFQTRAGVAGSPLVEAMRISGTGGVGIGATTLFNQSLRVSKNITGSTSCVGISNDGVIQSDVTTQAAYIQTSASTAAASFTIGSLRHFRALQGTIGAGSTVTSQYGFEVDSSLIGGTNNYGFYGNIASGTNRWNIYMNGTANNYMAGALGIGSATLTGYSLKVNKNITGATTSYGVTSEGTTLSDVTSGAVMFRSAPATQATAFTLTNVWHYLASALSVGAGSTVTNQYGFYSVDLTTATNNYGFYGLVSSGTNRWNLYMAGTAQNYLAGNTGIGVAAKTTAELSLGAGTTEQAQINLASSTAPTTPNDGDIWFDGTALKIRIGGVTKTVTVT